MTHGFPACPCPLIINPLVVNRGLALLLALFFLILCFFFLCFFALGQTYRQLIELGRQLPDRLIQDFKAKAILL